MQLTHLSLTNFRNFTRLDIDMPSGALLLVGGNAQGKTSLLEAVYFLATFVSFHASNDREMINFLAARETLAVSRIVADFDRGDGLHQMEVRLIQEPNGTIGSSRLRKEVLVDGVKLKLSEAVGVFNAVLFLPQMLRVVDGSPEERRRYLNLALSQAIPHYPLALTDYARALSQRNALLKQLWERSGDPAQLEFWDEQLVESGARLILARIRALQEMERLAARFHTDLTRSEEVLRIIYQPSYDPLRPGSGQTPGQFALRIDTPVDRSRISLEEIRRGFQEALQRVRPEEIARGVTTLGPHRDELRFLGNGIDLGTYGSRGQVRTAMLAMKLAEMSWMKEKTSHWPVLLLDEVLAELDTKRRADLLERLAQSEQSLMTTTDLDLFTPRFVKQTTVWEVQAGSIQRWKAGEGLA